MCGLLYVWLLLNEVSLYSIVTTQYDIGTSLRKVFGLRREFFLKRQSSMVQRHLQMCKRTNPEQYLFCPHMSGSRSPLPQPSWNKSRESKTRLYLASIEMTETNQTHTVCPALPCPSYGKVKVLTKTSTLSCLLQSDILMSFPLGPRVACHDLFP